MSLVREGRAVASQTIESIEDPRDLKPRIVPLRFGDSRPGDHVVVDPDNTVPEIAEHNNRLVVPAPDR